MSNAFTTMKITLSKEFARQVATLPPTGKAEELSQVLANHGAKGVPTKHHFGNQEHHSQTDRFLSDDLKNAVLEDTEPNEYQIAVSPQHEAQLRRALKGKEFSGAILSVS